MYSQRQENAKAVEMRFYLCDHLGTPNALLNDAGMADWGAQMDIWGNCNKIFNPKDIYQPIRLPGQNFDLEIQLIYNRERFYDPHIATYVNHDPIGFEGGLNVYRYVKNPLQMIDPLGLQWADADMRDKSREIKADGTGVRTGGAKGSIEVKAKGKVGAVEKEVKKEAKVEIGKSCTKEELSLWSKTWGFLKKTLSAKGKVGSAEVTVTPEVAIDPICVNPEQATRAAAAEVHDAVSNSGMADTVRGSRDAHTRRMEEAGL